MVRWLRMFSIQGFLTCKSKLLDELQTPQPIWKISDCQPCESFVRMGSATHLHRFSGIRLGQHKGDWWGQETRPCHLRGLVLDFWSHCHDCRHAGPLFAGVCAQWDVRGSQPLRGWSLDMVFFNRHHFILSFSRNRYGSTCPLHTGQSVATSTTKQFLDCSSALEAWWCDRMLTAMYWPLGVLVCISRRHRCPSLSPICIVHSNGLLDEDVICISIVVRKVMRPLQTGMASLTHTQLS